MNIIGYLASIFIGISLGLIGGGGSILTVPVLVYLFKIDIVSATAHSLFIVGITSLISSLSYFRNQLVNIKMVIIFGVPSLISVLLTRFYIVPAIPEIIFEMGGFVMMKSTMILLLFAILMILASYSMIRKEKKVEEKIDEKQSLNFPLMVMEGLIIGMMTSLVGAGGGFLIIPALIVLSKLKMKEAIGTSLVIIATQSLIGFWGEHESTLIDWQLLLAISAFAIFGSFVGTYLSKKLDGKKLKPAFGWFILAMGVYIILKELLLRSS